MARKLAKTIGYRYIDSGAMYRAVTLYAMRHGFIRPDGSVDAESLVDSLPSINIDFRVDDNGQQTMLNGEIVENVNPYARSIKPRIACGRDSCGKTFACQDAT